MNRPAKLRPARALFNAAVARTGASMLALSAPLWLSACASTPDAPVAATTQEPAGRSPAAILNGMEQRALAAVAEADKQFTGGDFKAVIASITSSKAIDFASTATQVQAHKLLAFSYCLTRKTALCYAEAQRVMQLDPTFQLPEAERSHPTWGPAFDAARKRAALPAKP